jgi:ATP-binding cassette subfamily B protein
MEATDKKKRSLDFILLWRIIRLASPYQWFFWLAIISTILVAISNPIRPYLIQIALDNHVALGDYAGLTRLSMLILILLIIQAVLQFGNGYLTSWISQKVIMNLRNDVFTKIQQMNLRFFDKTPVGTLVTRCVNDIETIAELFASGIITISGDLLQIITITAFMFYLDWELSLITLSVLPLLIYASHIFRIKVKQSFQDVRTAVARLNAFVQERITGMFLVQLYGKEAAEFKKFETINFEHYKANERSILYYSIFFPVIEIITAISLALLVWWGSIELLQTELNHFGKLTAFIIYINMFFRPIRMLADRFNTIQMGMVSAERIFKLLDDNHHLERITGNAKHPIVGNVEFDSVHFAYNNQVEVIRNLSFSLRQGEMLAIVGETGSGKTTIINLLLGFYPYQKGRIILDGHEISEYSFDYLRNNISVVLQDVFLFSGSVIDNITLNKPNISREKVVETSKLLGAHDFISKLEGNYDYKVMERGNTLSMGQKQLISFVRAMVTNPSILILDEATASVDSETEEMIQKAIDVMMKGRTSIVIAHRLSTIEKADQILVLKNGEKIAIDSHERLLQFCHPYMELYHSAKSLHDSSDVM